MECFRGSRPLQPCYSVRDSFDELPVKAPGAAGKALTTAELRHDKQDRHVFQTLRRLPIQVVLDGVRQGYNVGALLRLCDAFLCERLVICGQDGTRGTRKLVQAAQGTHHWVPLHEADSAIEAIQAARDEGYRIVAVKQTDNAISLSHFRPCYPVCLVLGSERAGVSPAVLCLADAAVAVPMRGMANSLNVATAAAIVLHAIADSRILA
jgi:23S rRNA (guanosine2251-2'-O)-methyltransferase